MMNFLPAIVLAAAPTSAIGAASEELDMLSPNDVEAIYWDCEFKATQRLLDLQEAGACGEIYEFLKERKFSGDFDRFMHWWQENKRHEFSKRQDAPPP